MPILHLGQVQIEVRRRSFPPVMCPAVGEQHATDIQEQAGDSGGQLRRPFARLKIGHGLPLHVRHVRHFRPPSFGGTDPGEDPRVPGSDLGPDHGSAEVVCPPAELPPRIRVSE